MYGWRLRGLGPAVLLLAYGAVHGQDAPLAQDPQVPGRPEQQSQVQPIDLQSALRLAGMHSVDLALVREAERQAVAFNDAATLRFFPWLAVGAGYAKHTGAGQNFNGDVLGVDKVLYGGAGSVNLQWDLGDAIFGKLAARQRQAAASAASDAKAADIQLSAAIGYLDLVNAAAGVDIANDALKLATQYETQLARAADIGLTNRSEVLRASVSVQRNQIALRQSQAALRESGISLATLLRLDPAVTLEPAERMASTPTLVSPDSPVLALVREALGARPELRSSAASIQASTQLRNAAKFGPWLPSIAADTLYGHLRGGPEGQLGPYMGSHDYLVGLNWRLGPGGILDPTRTAIAESQLRRDRLSDDRLRDEITRQVVSRLELARSAQDQIALARQAVDLADQALRLALQRREFGVSAVLEVLQAQQELTQTRTEYARSLTQYAQAQFSLAHAVARFGN